MNSYDQPIPDRRSDFDPDIVAVAAACLSQTRRARPGPSCNKQDGTASLEGCGYGAAARRGERHYRLEYEFILVCGCR